MDVCIGLAGGDLTVVGIHVVWESAVVVRSLFACIGLSVAKIILVGVQVVWEGADVVRSLVVGIRLSNICDGFWDGDIVGSSDDISTKDLYCNVSKGPSGKPPPNINSFMNIIGAESAIS